MAPAVLSRSKIFLVPQPYFAHVLRLTGVVAGAVWVFSSSDWYEEAVGHGPPEGYAGGGAYDDEEDDGGVADAHGGWLGVCTERMLMRTEGEGLSRRLIRQAKCVGMWRMGSATWPACRVLPVPGW